MKFKDINKIRRAKKFPKLGLIEQILYRENSIRDAVKEYRIDSPRPDTAGSIKSKGTTSSPTEVKALKNLIEIPCVTLHDGFSVRRPEKWLDVIDATYHYFDYDDVSRKAFAMRYRQNKNYIQITAELGLNPSTFYRTIEKGQDFAIAVACQLGLIRIYSKDK